MTRPEASVWPGRAFACGMAARVGGSETRPPQRSNSPDPPGRVGSRDYSSSNLYVGGLLMRDEVGRGRDSGHGGNANRRTQVPPLLAQRTGKKQKLS